MPRFGPIKRVALVRSLRKVGFEGPYSGSKHQILFGVLGRALDYAGVSLCGFNFLSNHYHLKRGA